MRRLVLLALVLALTAGSSTVQAQHRKSSRQSDSAPTGLMLNVQAFAMPGFSISGADIAGAIQTSMGPGLGAQVGYAITPQFLIFAGADIARLGAGGNTTGHWGLGMLELGGRMSFPTANGRVSPYVTASFGTRGIGAKLGNAGDISFDGLAFSGGGGLTYMLSQSLALDGGATLSLGKLGNYEDPLQKLDLNVGNTVTTRVRFGLNWYP